MEVSVGADTVVVNMAVASTEGIKLAFFGSPPTK
jgi:hypothetical protein